MSGVAAGQHHEQSCSDASDNRNRKDKMMKQRKAVAAVGDKSFIILFYSEHGERADMRRRINRVVKSMARKEYLDEYMLQEELVLHGIRATVEDITNS